jgi:hypothetical protein
LVEVGYLALIWYDWPEALAIDHRDELPQSAFECFNHALEAGVAVAVADLSPVVQETVTLHLEQLGLFPVDKVDPVHVGSRHDLKIDIWNRESSGGSKNLIHRREIRMLLDDGKLALELSCQTNPRWGDNTSVTGGESKFGKSAGRVAMPRDSIVARPLAGAGIDVPWNNDIGA